MNIPADVLVWSRGISGYFWIVSLSEPEFEPDLLCRPQQLVPNMPAWKRLAEVESRRLTDQQARLLVIHESNEKDDTTPWLNRTKWPKLFAGKDLKVRALYFLEITLTREAYRLY